MSRSIDMNAVFQDALEILEGLIQIPSPSGKEKQVAEFLENKVREFFPGSVTRKGNNLIVDLVGDSPGSTLLLCSHIDTVEATAGWTHDPFRAEKVGDKIFGLGANDAGASLVSLIASARLIGVPKNGRVLLALVAEEEVGDQGFYTIESSLPRYDGAIFGEPTDLRVATCMRGSIRFTLRSRGIGCHASQPAKGRNAIDQMISDILTIRSIDLKDSSPWGGATMEPTIITGGKMSNQLPDLVETTFDVRSTPEKNNDWILSRLAETKVEIGAVCDRRRPMYVHPESKIVRAYRENYLGVPDCVFNGSCDMAFSSAPGIILGPGSLDVAHVADEYTRPSEIKRAISVYHNVIGSFLSL